MSITREARQAKLAQYDAMSADEQRQDQFDTLMLLSDDQFLQVFAHRDRPDVRASMAVTQGCRDFAPEVLDLVFQAKGLDGSGRQGLTSVSDTRRPAPTPVPGAAPVLTTGAASPVSGRATGAAAVPAEAGAAAPDPELEAIRRFAQQLGYSAVQLDQSETIQQEVMQLWEQHQSLMSLAKAFGFRPEHVDRSEPLQAALMEILDLGRQHLQELGLLGG